MNASRLPLDVELWTYRIVCLLGGLALPVSGWLFEQMGLATVDPLWMRAILGALPLTLFGASFFSKQVRSELPGLTTVVVYVFVLWFSVIAYLNGLTTEYAVAGLVLVVVMAVVAGTVQARLRTVGLALGLSVAAFTIVTLLVDEPGVSQGAYIWALVAAAMALFLKAWAQQRLRNDLRASEERYRTVFERVADGILLVEADTMLVIVANEAYRRMTGYSAQEITSRTLDELLDIRTDEMEVHIRSARAEGYVELGERAHGRRHGSPIQVDVSLSFAPDDSGGTICATIRDLTELKRARAQINLARDQANGMLELRSAFLNNMSHEIRTPLVSLVGFLSVLEDEAGKLDTADLRAMTSSLRRSAERLNSTLNAVLDLAQIEGGEFQLEPEPLDLGETAKQAMARLRHLAAEKRLAFNLHSNETARIVADRSALDRVLTNIFENAIKYTDSGEVTAAIEADSHRVRLLIRDTGIGIDPSFLPHLFGAFRQGSNGLARKYEGSGLGLTLAKRLLDLMGGRIRVESEPGEGTCITLTFARTFASADGQFQGDGGTEADAPSVYPQAAHHRVARAIEPLAPRARVLVVEDNADTARLFKRMLRDHFDVDVAPHAEAAFKRAQRAWYDLLLIDIHLGPGCDGIELLGRLRALSAYAHVPAIAVTTYTATGDRERFLGAGFDAYVPKPFTKAQLLRATEEAHAERALSAT